MPAIVNDGPACVYFKFRAIREEMDIDFKLIEIQGQLVIAHEGGFQKVSDKSFGMQNGFPSKTQIIQGLVEEYRKKLDKVTSLTNSYGMGKNLAVVLPSDRKLKRGP